MKIFYVPTSIKIIAVIMSTIGLFACNSEKITEPDGKLDSCTLRFSWWGGDDRHSVTLKAIELWEKTHPEIKIEPEYGGWDGWTEKINTQVAGNTAPDVMQINYDWLVTLSSDGKGFYDLDKLTDYIDLSGYSDEILSFGKSQNCLNAITVSMSGRGFFYNYDVYKKLGISYPKTWNELITSGNKFESEDVYPFDLDTQSGATAWYLCVVYIQQTTGKQFLTMDGKLGFNEADIKSALDFYVTLEQNHIIRTVKERSDEDGNDALYQSPSFINGKVAGVFEWGSTIGKYESLLENAKLEAGPYLSNDSGNKNGWMTKPSLLYAISADTKYPDEAAEFINFLLNDTDCAEIFGTTRGIPANKKIYDFLESKNELSGISYDSSEMLSDANPITVSPYMELSKMKEYYNNAIDSVSYHTATTEEAAAKMYDSITRYLRKINES